LRSSSCPQFFVFCMLAFEGGTEIKKEPCLCTVPMSRLFGLFGQSSSSLLGDDSVLSLLGGSSLNTKLTSSPGLSDLGVLVEAIRGTGCDCLESAHITSVNIGESQCGGSLLVDDSTEARLALDDDVGDVHLSAKSGQPDNELNGLDVVSNHDKLGLLLLNQSGDVVQSVLDAVDLGRWLSDLGVLVLGGGSQQSSLLLNSSLGSVLVQQLEQLNGRWLVSSSGELVERGGNLQSVQQDSLLSLEDDVSGPLNESSEISLGLNVLSNSEVSGSSLDQRVLSTLLRCLLSGGSRLLGRGL